LRVSKYPVIEKAFSNEARAARAALTEAHAVEAFRSYMTYIPYAQKNKEETGDIKHSR